ncbi:MAG: GntR family transcriptional regulator [Clostridia bacterium]|nr:GntR family transcriptional regulator [Clostridia bacterium]
MEKLFNRLKQPSLKDMCMQALLGKILSGHLKPGDRLPAERELSEQLGVSRSSVNHAVMELATLGFVEIVPRRGTVVRDYRKHPTPQSLAAVMSYGSFELDAELFNDLMSFRRLVETECARLACENIYETTYNEMAELVERFAAGEGDLAENLYGFHYRLTQASGNLMYSMIFSGFEPLIRTLIARHYMLRSADTGELAERYRALLAAISAHDAPLAERLIGEILERGVSALRGS